MIKIGKDREKDIEKSRPKEQTGRDLPRRMRHRDRRDKVTGIVLYSLLGILSVVLVVALVWQEYYFTHTYEKGELSQLSQGEDPPQRLKFMTEADTETVDGSAAGTSGDANTPAADGSSSETGDDADGSSSGTGDGAGENGSGTGEVTGENGAESGGTFTGTSSGGKIAVETTESVSLKNQLIGVLPGIAAPGQTAAEMIAQADRLAAMYDYDRAAELLKNCTSYNSDQSMQEAVARYQAEKAACVSYPVTEVTHVFFHTLIKDPDKAFDGDQYEAGYNQYMVTISEFNSIIQQMYDNGYVLVTLQDMAPTEKAADGTTTFSQGQILLPEGKKPFVLSQDDVCYYHYMDGDGFASKLIVDGNGDIKNEYIEDDGSISVGDYDMVPLIDRFLEEHPDFSYRGAKGYIALTGYDGILGYRTDICYKTRENLDTYQEIFFQENPGFSEADYERECQESKKVAEALRADGWLFASHTWGHVGLGENATTFEQFKADTDKWEERVEPLIGETDTLIYAFGGDIGGVEDYSGDRFEYLKEKGFNYFCGVDSAVYWVQIRENYVRQARRNIDGYRMFYNPDMLSDLFDVSKAWDPKRPEYVPQI